MQTKSTFLFSLLLEGTILRNSFYKNPKHPLVTEPVLRSLLLLLLVSRQGRGLVRVQDRTTVQTTF